MPMNQSSFCRLIRPFVSSTIGGTKKNALHGGILKRYITYDYGFLPQHPFSLIEPWITIEPLGECTLTPHLHEIPVPPYEILGPGMILLKKYVSLKDQVDIVNMCQKWCTKPGGFNKPSYQVNMCRKWCAKPTGFTKPSDQVSRHHMCFGRNWDSETRYTNPYRSDGSEPPPVPHELTSLAQTAIQVAQGRLGKAHMGELPSICPDTCSVSFYELGDELRLHQDFEESSDAIRRGLPVVSISIGDDTEFLYGYTRDENKLNKVLLESGDVLIYGGTSRLIYHAVSEIYLSGAEALGCATALRSGYLNLTLKQF